MHFPLQCKGVTCLVTLITTLQICMANGHLSGLKEHCEPINQREHRVLVHLLQKQLLLKVITLISEALTYDQYLPLLLAKNAYITPLQKNSSEAWISSPICSTGIQSLEIMSQYPNLTAIYRILCQICLHKLLSGYGYIHS